MRVDTPPGFERVSEFSIRCPGCSLVVRLLAAGQVDHEHPVCGRFKQLQADKNLAGFLEEAGAVVSRSDAPS